MKSNSTRTFSGSFLKAIPAFLLLVAVVSCTVVESVPASETNDAKKVADNVSRTSRKDRAVKIYPDIVKRVMHVKNTEASPLDFYVFDPAGTLVVHYKMDEKDHKKITGLKRGSYIYQVFEKDEMTESGKLNIR